MEWKQIHTTPFERDLELAVIDRGGMQIVAFRCRRLSDNGWLDVETDKQVYHLSPRTGGIGHATKPFQIFMRTVTTRAEVRSTKPVFQTHNRICCMSRCDERYCV